jgi:hypothetical protein
MKVTRDVIVDLLPLYVAGEASPDTRALVDEYLKGDAELARSARANELESLSGMALPALQEDGEVKALRRTRAWLHWKRRLYAWSVTFSILSLSCVVYIRQGHLAVQFLLSGYPKLWGGCISLAITGWINYLVILRRLRTNI